MRIVGCVRSSFTGKDGTVITGMTLWLSEPLDESKGGRGIQCYRQFVSDRKLAECGISSLDVGDEINLWFTRFGRLDAIIKMNGDDE